MYQFYRQGWWLAVLRMVGLGACAPQSATTESPVSPPLACDSIFSPELLALDLDDVPEEEFQAWVSEHYGARGLMSSTAFYMLQMEKVNSGSQRRPDAKAIAIQTLSENVITSGNAVESKYEWMWQGQLYRASYHIEEQRLLGIDIKFDPQPTLADVERCYGTPEFYKRAFYTHDFEWKIPYLLKKPTYSTSFTLYYPEQGLTFFDSRDGDGHSKPTITMNTPVSTGSVLRAGRLLDLMNDGVPGFNHNEGNASPFTTWEAWQY